MLRGIASFLLVLVATFVVTAQVAAQGTNPFTVHDLVAMDRIGDWQVSPDAELIVFVKSSLDLEANRRRSDLWLVHSDGTGLRQLTTDPASDFNPRWSPNGESIWFLSTRSGSSQAWRISVQGGEAQQVSSLPLGVGNLTLSPSGSQLAFTMDVFPDCASLECTVSRLHDREQLATSGVLYERIFVRHWDTWKDGRRSHLFVMPAGGGEAVDVTPGMDADTP